MLEVKSVNEVFRIIKDHFSGYILPQEVIDIKDGVYRILAENILSGEDIPGFDRSSVDGYAVASKDTFGAGETLPAQLSLVGEVKMGQKPDFSLSRGQAAYVPTGGEIPSGADAVVMIEYTENYNDGYIYINKSAAPGNNIVFRGDDVKAGSKVLQADFLLKPKDIGVLAALGYEKIKVKQKIKVGIISTGDEIVGIHEDPGYSKVRDINSYTLYSGIQDLGCEPKMYGIVRDHYDSIREIVKSALDACDVVLISGGSSVGIKDETYKVIDSFGAPGVLVHGIAVKPGKPTIIGKVQGKAVIGLPGHPASAFVIFKVFVSYIFDIIYGIGDKYKKTINAKMVCNYPSNHGREEFIPVMIKEDQDEIMVEPIFGKSGLITLLSEADGYVHLERGLEGIPAGQEVKVVLF